MAFSDLCHISNAFKAVENEADQSDRIMEENSMVRDLITKILDETGTEGNDVIPPPEKPTIPSNINQYPKNDSGTFLPSSPSYNYNNNHNLYNFNQNDSGLFNIQNGFISNGFVNYSDNDVHSLLGVDPITETEAVTPEHLNLLRLAAQEIGGAQFTSPNKYDEKFYNFFEPNQRNSLPETNMFSNNYNRPNSLNLDLNYNTNYEIPFNTQRFPNKYDNGFLKDQTQDSTTDLLTYLNQINISGDRPRDDIMQNDYKMPVDMNSPYQNEEYKMQEERNKMFFNRNYPAPNKNFNNDYFMNDVMPMPDRNMNQNYEFSNQTIPGMGYKPNGFHPQNDFIQRRDVNQMLPRESFQGNGNVERVNFDLGRENVQQTLLRQQEIARQMNVLMRNRPPPNPLNVDVSFIHEPPFNLGLGALLGPSPPVPPPVLQSPMLDMPLLAPFYAMRNIRNAAPSSSVLHARLDACYEQWRQLERERKRTEARLALAYPGRAVSSSNSIPVPRLPPCPTRVDRLTVDMLREHTKVLTLMGKMETLRASVCVAQNKRPNKPEENKITVLKRGQDNVSDKEEGFDPSSWRDDVKHLSEIAPHSEVESAMLAWRSAVAAVQAARRRELNVAHLRYRTDRDRDPILQLADAVKQLCVCARRARTAMWCDLTLTVALAPHAPHSEHSPTLTTQTASPKQTSQDSSASSTPHKPISSEHNEEKPETQSTEESKDDQKQKLTDKDKNQRRTQNYRKVNQRNDFYQKNQRYDNRFVHNRHPYHYLATGSIN